MQTVSLKLANRLLAELKDAARARGLTKSALTRESLEKMLRQESSREKRSCHDLARDLAGSVKDLPEDLADHPRYTKDFGG